MGLFYHVLVSMGDLHLVHLALNLSILDAGILIMVQQISLMMFFLNMADYPLPSSRCPPKICLAGQVEGTLLKHSYPLEFFLWEPSFMLKS